MKRALLLFIAAFLLFADVNAQSPDTLVIEFTAPVKNRFSVAGLLALRSQGQTDFDEDGVPELVLFETDDDGNQTKIVAMDGRTRSMKWEADLTNLSTGQSSLNKLSQGFRYTHRDSLIWRGFRKIRKIRGLNKSTSANSERLAVISGQRGGVLALDPATNEALLSLGDDFRLLGILDIDGDQKDELIIGNKKTRRIFIVGDGTTE